MSCLDIPKISIIVPVFNVEKFLNKCIDSILNQTFKDFELILVDGGSPDNSGIICDEYAEKDKRIKVIHKKDLGLSDDRNAGLDIAKGEYIGFVDSDDWVDSHMFEILYKYITENNADIVQCKYARSKGKDINCSRDVNKVEVYTGKEAVKKIYDVKDRYISIPYTVVWNKLYKRKFFENVRFPIGKFSEDQFVTFLNFYRAKKVIVIDCPLYYYRMNLKSQSNKSYTIRSQDDLLGQIFQLEFFKKKNETEIYNLILKKVINVITSHYETSKEILKDKKNLKKLLKESRKLYKDVINNNLIENVGKLKYTIFVISPTIFKMLCLEMRR